MTAHSVYTLRRRTEADGPGGPLATDYHATVVGARSGAEAGAVYFAATNATDVVQVDRVSTRATVDGRTVVVFTRKEQV